MNEQPVGPNSTYTHPLQCIKLFSSISAAFFNIHFSQENKLKAEADEREGNKKRYQTIRNVYGELTVISDPYELHIHLRCVPSLRIQTYSSLISAKITV
jgi:hypothetical protein